MTEPNAATTPPGPPPPAAFSSEPRPRRPRPTLPELRPIQAAWLAVAAILVDVGLRSGVSTLGATLAAIVIAVAIIGPVVLSSKPATALTATAIVFALWLVMRASPALTALNALAVASALVAAAALTQPLRLVLSTRTITTLISRVLQSRFGLSVLAPVAAPLRTTRSTKVMPIVRGALIAIIPVTVLGALLASADVVFADSLTTDVDWGGWIGHVVLTLFAAAGITGLVAVMGLQPNEDFAEHRPLGATEALVLLVSIGGLYAAFAVVQLLSALGRSDRILAERGISYAEYARSGFFQLLWVAALTIGLLAAVRVFVADGTSTIHRAVRGVGAVVSLLTIVIVLVAIIRLGLYTDEFGQTTLRWYCTAFAWMLGVAFVAIALGHAKPMESALPGALVAIAVATLFAVNVLNPEARVAEHNLTRSDAAESLDAEYLSRLSADAWPALIEHKSLMTSRLAGIDRFPRLCAEADSSRGYGPLGFNLALSRLNCSS